MAQALPSPFYPLHGIASCGTFGSRLLKRFFPDDEKTLKKLEELHAKYKIKKEYAKETARERRKGRANDKRSIKKTTAE